MAQADGTILIDTEINADGMKAGSKEVESAVRRMAASVNDLGTKAKTALNRQVDAFSKLNNEYAAQQKKVDDLKKKVQEYANQKIPTQEYKEISAQIAQAQAKLTKLLDAQERFLATGGKKGSTPYKRMQYDIDQLSDTIKYARGELKDLEATGKAFTLGNQTKEAAADMHRLEAEMRKLSDMNNRLGTSYASIKGQINDYQKQLLETDTVQKKTIKSSDRLNKSIKNTSKSSKSANFGLGKMLGTSILFSFAFQAINGVITAVTEGFTNLAQYSGTTNNSISMLWSSLERLKNSLATAFAPILDVVAPILSQFIDMLSTAATYVSMFFSFLTGKSSYTKAVAVQRDYAASLEDTAGAANDAADAMDRYLSPLDDMNKYQSQNSGASPSGGGAAAIDPSQMFEEVAIDPKMLAFFERIKTLFQPIIDAIERLRKPVMEFLSTVGDTLMWLWDTVLSPIVTWLISSAIPRIIDILGKLFELATVILDWFNKNVLPVIEPIITAVVDLFIGLGDGIITVFDGLLEFLIGVFTGDWDRAFSGLSEIFEGFSQTVNSICDFIQSILNTFDGWLQNVFSVDWRYIFGDILGSALEGFFQNVKNIWNGIKEIFNGVITFIRGVFSGNWRQAWEGVKQIFKGVWNTLASIIKTPINGIIAAINGLINGAVSGINAVIRALNRLSFDVPDWVPFAGGKHFGFNISQITAPKIPYLASGAVIPPNKQFMAVLGDQKQGNNIEAPESLIRRIVREETGGNSGVHRIEVPVYLDRRKIAYAVVDAAKLIRTQTGKNPLELA